MRLGVRAIANVPYAVTHEMRVLEASISAGWEQQHGPDGEHSSILADRLGTNDGAVLPVSCGLRFLAGPWLFNADGNATSSDGDAAVRTAQITADQNDYAPLGMAKAVIIEIESDAARTITGLMIAARQRRMLWVMNRGNFSITWAHNSSSSAAVNRIAHASSADYEQRSGEVVAFLYDVGSRVWRSWAVGGGVIKRVQEGSTQINSGANSATSTITSVNAAKAYVFPREHAGNDVNGDSTARPTLTNATTVTVNRSTSNNTITYYWTVVEFN